MASAESVLDEVHKELKAMHSWSVELYEAHLDFFDSIDSGKIVQLARQVNTQGRRLEWRYIRKLNSVGVDAKIVNKLSKCVSSARVAAQRIQAGVQKIENDQNPRKSLFHLLKTRVLHGTSYDYEHGKVGGTPSHLGKIRKTHLAKDASILVEDLRQALELLDQLKPRRVGLT